MGWEEPEEEHTIERDQNMHRMRIYLWKHMQETGGARGWNSRDGICNPKIWREWSAWPLAAVDQEFSQGVTGMYKIFEMALLSLLSMGWKISVHSWTEA